MSTQTIKDYSQLAATAARSMWWALRVLGRSALRILGRSIRNALPGRKEQQLGEARKEEWVLGFEPSRTGWATIGFIATQWDDAPRVGMATTYFTMPASEIQAISQKSMASVSVENIAFLIMEALHANLQVEDLGQFSQFLASLLGQDEMFAAGLANGYFGFLVTFKARNDRYRFPDDSPSG